MFLIRELLGLQLVEIGTAFGGRDHSTVIHSLDKVRHELGTDSAFQSRVQRIRYQLEAMRH
jgi:chromosomal replication initiator protein